MINLKTIFIALILLILPIAASAVFYSKPGPTPAAATVTTVVASNPATGTVTSGNITFTVNFSAAVTVFIGIGQPPTLNLNTAVASHAIFQPAQSSPYALVFLYTVQTGATANPVATATTSAISLNGSTITNGNVTSNLAGANNQSFPGLILNPAGTPSPNGFVVAAPSSTPVIDSTGVAWTTTSSTAAMPTGCGSNPVPCLAANGGVVGGSGIVELAYVNSTVWQLNTAGNWYSATFVGGVWNTPLGPSTQSPLTSPLNTTLSTVAAIDGGGVNNPAIVDAASPTFNDWTITSGGQMAVNGTPITVTSAVTSLCYSPSGNVWQFGSGAWYEVVTVNGANTTFTTPGVSTNPCPTAAGTAVAMGLEAYVVLTSNTTTTCGALLGPTNPSGEGTWGGPGSTPWDASWDQVTAMMGRAPKTLTTYLSGVGYTTNLWSVNAAADLNCNSNNYLNPHPMTSDTRTNAASGTIPQIGWPMGDASGVGNNYFAEIASGADDCIIENVLSQYNAAGYHTLFIRPALEMNGNWFGWSVTASNYSGASGFDAAWIDMYKVIHAYAAGTSTLQCSGSIQAPGTSGPYGSVPLTAGSGGSVYNASPLMTISVGLAPNQGNVESSPSLLLSQWVGPLAAYIDNYSIDFYSGYQPNCVDGGSPACGGTAGTFWVPTVQNAYAKANNKPISGSEIGGLNAQWAANYVALLASTTASGTPILYWDWWDSQTAGTTSQEVGAGVGSWSNASDTNCTSTPGNATTGAGSLPGILCGATTGAAPTANPSTAFSWYVGFNSTNGTVQNPATTTQVPIGCECSGDGQGSTVFDQVWDSMIALFGRSPTISDTYEQDVESQWPSFATSIAASFQSDSRTNSASGVIPLIGWPFGSVNAGGGNFYSNISTGADDCLIMGGLQSFNNASGGGFHTLILRPAWEFNTGDYGFTVNNSTDASNLNAALQHYYRLVHAYAAGTTASLGAGFQVSCGAGTASNASPTMTLDVTYNPGVGGSPGGLPFATTMFPGCSFVDSLSIDDYGNFNPPTIGNYAQAGGIANASSDGGLWYTPALMVSMAKSCSPVKPIGGSEIGGLNNLFASNYVTWLNTVGVPIAYWSFWNNDGDLSVSQATGTFSLTSDTWCSAGGTTGAGTSPGGVSCGATGGTPLANSVAAAWNNGFHVNTGTISGNQ